MSELLLQREDDVEELSPLSQDRTCEAKIQASLDELAESEASEQQMVEEEIRNATNDPITFKKSIVKLRNSLHTSTKLTSGYNVSSSYSTITSKFKNSFRKTLLTQETENDVQTKNITDSLEKSNRIYSLTSESTLRICANQVIIDLATAIKEVLENSIDSGATRIEVKVKQYGLDGFQISDNGTGIHPDDYETISRRHATSKLRSFDGLDQAYSHSFGFRGEALSSLCALAHVSILTCTQDQEPLGTKLEFHIDGRIKKRISMAAKRGTTVFVSNLFEQIPVRSTEFIKNSKREFAKTVELLQQYAVGCTQCRISCWHLLASGNASYKSNLLFATNLPSSQPAGTLSSKIGLKTAKDNLICVFGSQGLSDMSEIQFTTQDDVAHLHGFITQGPSRPSSDRQFLFLHGRPVDIPKLSRCINQAYKVVYPSFFPVFALDIKIATGHFDINVTPDKRTVFISNEENILEEFRGFFETFFDPSSMQVVPQRMSQTLLTSFHSSTLPTTPSAVKDPLPSLVNDLQLQTPLSQRVKKRLWSFHSPQSTTSPLETSPTISDTKRRAPCSSTQDADSTSSIFSCSPLRANTSDSLFPSSSQPSSHPSFTSSSPKTTPLSFAPVSDSKTVCAESSDSSSNSSQSNDLLNTTETENPMFSESIPTNAEDPVDTRVRTLTKKDFEAMQVHGQFNLGFLLVSLNEKDLFIVDQHASDEKYRYEQLMAQMHVDRQPLMHPIPLDRHLSPMDLETVMHHRGWVHQQGFTVNTEMELITVPLIQGEAFGVAQLTQLVHQLQDTPKASLVVLDQIKAMFASKACRSSIMIGTPLEMKTMQRILMHLSTLHQPWNCPHGRPTVRFLYDLQKLSTQDQSSQRRNSFQCHGSFFNDLQS